MIESTPSVLALFWQQHPWPTSLFIFKCFFVLVCYFCEIYSKLCSKNIRDGSKIEIMRIQIILSITKNLERKSTAGARESQDFHVRGTSDVSIKLQLSLCAIMAS